MPLPAYKPRFFAVAVALALGPQGCGEGRDPIPDPHPTPDAHEPDPTPDPGAAPDADPAPDGGSASARLVPWRIGVEGAAALTVHVFDRELDRPCSFVTASDGVLRCLPVDPRPKDMYGAFADPACRQPVYTWQPDGASHPGAPPKYATAGSTRGPCETWFEVYELVRKDPKPFFGRFGDGACRPLEPRVIPPGTILLVGYSLVPPATFVEGRRVVSAPAARDSLGVEQIETSSGGPFATGIHDPRWRRTCQLEKAASGELAPCWPEHARTGRSWFTDSRCATRLASSQAACPSPVLIRDANDRPAQLGKPWPGAVFMGDQGCRLASARDRDSAYFELGTPLEPDVISTLRWEPYGTGRMRVHIPTSKSGRLFDLGYRAVPRVTPFQDTERRSECEPMRAPDGAIRCVSRSPDLLATDYFFEDAACSRPLVSCTSGRCEALAVLVVKQDQDTGPVAARLHAVGPRFAGPAFIGYAGACARADMTTSPALWQIGGEIAWDRFPRLDEWRGSERVPSAGP